MGRSSHPGPYALVQSGATHDFALDLHALLMGYIFHFGYVHFICAKARYVLISICIHLMLINKKHPLNKYIFNAPKEGAIYSAEPRWLDAGDPTGITHD